MKRRFVCIQQWSTNKNRSWRAWAVMSACIAFTVAISQAPEGYAVVVTDDFTDNNDTANPAWTHLNGVVGTTGQTWTVSDGKYRLFSPTFTNQGSMDPRVLGYDFVGSHAGPEFTDVRVSADFVDLPVGSSSPVLLPSWFGVAARLNGNNSPPDPAAGLQLHGYTYHYESTASDGLGEMVLGFLWGGGLKDIGSQKVFLDPSQDYRFVLEVLGDVLHGQVYHLDGSSPSGTLIAEDFRDVVNEPVVDDHDLDDDAVTPEQPLEPYTSGFSGIFGVGHVFFFEPEFSADNFSTESAVAGDYNRNGEVDAADYVLWRKTVGQTSPTFNPPLLEDFVDPELGIQRLAANGAVTNGYTQTIDQSDYDSWRANFGTSVGAASGLGSAVPEPATALLVLLAVPAIHRLLPSRRLVGGQ